MADHEDFSPTDGLTNTWIKFESLTRGRKEGELEITFRIVDTDGDHERSIGSISIAAEVRGDGMEGCLARAYGELILILRQGIYTSRVMRDDYRQVAEKISAIK